MFARLMRVPILALGAATLVAIAGCGGSDSSDKTTSSAAKTTSSTSTAAKAPASAAGLEKPLFATCGVKRFQKPQKAPLVGAGGAQYWRVVYLLPATAPTIEGQPSNLTLVEQTPAGPRRKLDGGHDEVIGKITVSLRPGNSKTPANVAQWTTPKARYVLIADGGLPALRKLIPCFP